MKILGLYLVASVVASCGMAPQKLDRRSQEEAIKRSNGDSEKADTVESRRSASKDQGRSGSGGGGDQSSPASSPVPDPSADPSSSISPSPSPSVAAPPLCQSKSMKSNPLNVNPGAAAYRPVFGFQSDGKMVTAFTHKQDDASPGTIRLKRFDCEGVVDTNFGSAGTLDPGVLSHVAFVAESEIHIAADDKIVVVTDSLRYNAAGTAIGADLVVMRMTKNGAMDASYGDGGITRMTNFGDASRPVRFLDRKSSVLLKNGSVVVAQSSIYPGGIAGTFYAKFNDRGQLDAGFGNNGILSMTAPLNGTDDDQAYLLKAFPDGGFVSLNFQAGNATPPSSEVDPVLTRTRIIKFNAAGVVDSSFAAQGRLDLPNCTVQSLNVFRNWSSEIFAAEKDYWLLACMKFVPLAGAVNFFAGVPQIIKVNYSGRLVENFGNAGIAEVRTRPVALVGASVATSEKIVGLHVLPSGSINLIATDNLALGGPYEIRMARLNQKGERMDITPGVQTLALATRDESDLIASFFGFSDGRFNLSLAPSNTRMAAPAPRPYLGIGNGARVIRFGVNGNRE